MANILINAVEFRRTNEEVYSWIERGLWEPAEYRGSNTVIPGKAGELAQPLVVGKRVIVMPMVIKAASDSAFLTLSDEVKAVWVASQAAPVEMQVHGPMYGIAAGAHRKCNVRYLNAIGPKWLTARVRALWTVELVCVDSPPEWVQVGP